MLDTALVSPLRSPVDVTLVVTYSVSRLYMLDGLCLSWGGPVSAAVYQVGPKHTLASLLDPNPGDRTLPVPRPLSRSPLKFINHRKEVPEWSLCT